jgi:peptidase E
MKLILLSGDFLPDFATKALTEFIKVENSKIKIAFCANAGDLYEGDKRKYIDAARSKLISEGYSITDIDLNNPEEALNILSEVNASYFTGGNYYHLMHLFTKSGIIEKYIELVKNGLVHIGFSSGAMICSPDFKAYRLIDEPEIHKIEKGLGLFPYYIIPHYSNKPKFTKAYEDIINAGIENVIALENSQGIIVNDNEWEIKP